MAEKHKAENWDGVSHAEKEKKMGKEESSLFRPLLLRCMLLYQELRSHTISTTNQETKPYDTNKPKIQMDRGQVISKERKRNVPKVLQDAN